MKNTIKVVGLYICMVILGAGCSTAKLGDNKLGPVPVPAIAAAADVAQPGAGKIITRAEGAIAAYVEAKGSTNAPFGGLPFTTETVIILKQPVAGLTITPDQIDTIRRTRTPIAPPAIVEAITLDQLAETPKAGGWTDIINRVNEIRENLAGTNSASLNDEALEALVVTP